MSPSPPFPSPLPPSHSSSSPHPGVIGEHRSAIQHLQQQQAAVEPPNGDYLLHLLQSGSQLQQHNVGNGEPRGGVYEQHGQYSFSLPGIVSGGDIPMAAWDPAVAALGPSHSYSHNGFGGGAAGDARDFLPGPYPPQYRSTISGWSSQQQHLFPSAPSSSSSLSSSLVDRRLIQGRTTGHSLGPIPGTTLPSSLFGNHVDMVQRRPADWNQNHPPPTQQHHHHHHHHQQLRGMLTESDISGNSPNLSSNGRGSLSVERSPHQQFFGDGAELMKLLQISTSKSATGLAGTDLKVDNQSGLGVGGSCSAVQKVSPAIVHGPIGPPKRNECNRPSPADDLLGRFWPAPVVSLPNGSQDISNSNGKVPGFAYKENQANFGSFPVAKERSWWGEHPAEKKFELSGGCDPVGHPPFGNSDGARYGLGGRIYSMNKGAPPDSSDYHSGRGLLGGWAGDFFEESVMASQQHRKSSGSRPREDHYVKHIESSMNLNPNHPESQHVEGTLKESELEYSRDNGRVEGSRGSVGGRKGSGSRGEIGGRRGGRTVIGQWVAVNERHRERDGMEISGHSEGAESGSDKGSNSTGNSCKEETVVGPKEGSGSQKVRDDLKRRRGQQQEWRMKTPPAHSQIQAQAQSSSPQPSDLPSGSESPELINGSYQLSPPLKIRPLALQVDHPGLPSNIVQDSASVPGSAMEDAKKLNNDRASNHSNGRNEENEEGLRKEDEEELAETFAGYLDLVDDQEVGHRHVVSLARAQEEVDYETRQEQSRELRRNAQRTFASPSLKPEMRYRPDLEKFTPLLLAMYESLIPSEDEEQKRRQFLSHLDHLVAREWAGALLFLFGSCANAFGVCNSDIDVCLSVNDDQLSKADLVLKMAAILRSDNMQNVQALTHARVPIVKFTDAKTGISCDICVNNMLAVVNSKLLHDYSQIDVRLRQLAFLVKHWAKRRQVNETYRGTLSSYAYVLMCIHFLQQRKPAILPCLQDMRPTYRVNVGSINCSYFDQVETLQNFGVANKETLGELLTAFFEYWAFRHDYNRAVISVRTGGYLSKDEKEWTRRIGNERHLICIEDPLEVVHDLGRVVDRHSIRVLRDEFHRAAKILRHDVNPCTTLFEPFIREKP